MAIVNKLPVKLILLPITQAMCVIIGTLVITIRPISVTSYYVITIIIRYDWIQTNTILRINVT